jgi:putative transposase
MSRKPKGLQNTLQVRLYPTPEQSHVLMSHCQEYISMVDVLVSALDADVIAHDDTFSTKDFVTALPSCVKNQALRDARSVFKRALELDCIPVLKKPICPWNNQNWSLEQGILTVPVSLGGKTQQIHIHCADVALAGLPGILRIKKKRGKWIADVTMTIAKPKSVEQDGVMGIDLGMKVPAVAYVSGKGARFFGNGRSQRYMRRRFYARRKSLQKVKKVRAVKKSQGKEVRWMKNTWSFSQLTHFISYKAERLGVRVEAVDPAYTSQECPACSTHNKAQDRTYVCAECGWRGHRDTVGAIIISRRAGLAGDRRGATGA